MADKWERLPAETDHAWDMFTLYRNMGLKRSYRAVSEEHNITISTVKRYALEYNWHERIRAWDDEVDRYTRERLKMERAASAIHHYDIATGFIDKVIEGIKHLEPSKMTPRDLIHAFDIAVKVQRLSTDQATEINDTRSDAAKDAANDRVRALLADPERARMLRELGEGIVNERPVDPGRPDTGRTAPALRLVESGEPRDEPD